MKKPELTTEGVNPSWNIPSPANKEPMSLGIVVKARQAVKDLNISSSKLTLLCRRGVVRKYNAHYWGGLLKEDVDKLAVIYKKFGDSSNRSRALEEEMAAEHMMDHVANIPIMKANAAYRDAVKDPTRPLSRICRRLVGASNRPAKSEALYQYLHLLDEGTLNLRTALSMREWVIANSKSHSRFEVNRVTLPPPSKWGDPRHAEVVMLLINAASTLYNIDFDVMAVKDYNAVALSPNSTTLMAHINGQAILNRDHLDVTLREAKETADHLPLNLRVDYWYRCLLNLMNTGSFSSSSIKYSDNVIRQLLAPSEQEESSAIEEAKNAVNKAVGAHWYHLYDSKWLPIFVGELPYIETVEHKGCFDLNPVNKQTHPDIVQEDTPEVVWLRNRSNINAVAEGIDIKLLKKLQRLLMEFHRKVAMSIPISARLDASFSTVLVKALTRQGIDPGKVYLKPYENAQFLVKNFSLVEKAYVKTLESLGMAEPTEDEVVETGARASEMSVDNHQPDNELPEAFSGIEDPANLGIEITDDDRLQFVKPFFEHRKRTFNDDATDENLISQLGGKLRKLDEFIMGEWGYGDDSP